MSEDVREHPHGWSLLACAILKTIAENKKMGKRVVMSKSWYENLLTLANRYTGVKYVSKT